MSAIRKLTVTLSDGTSRVLVPGAPGQAVPKFYVQPDQFTAHWAYKVRPDAPCPAVFRTGVIDDPLSFQRAPFTEAWQWYAAELLALAAFDRRYAQLDQAGKDYVGRKFSDLYNHYKAFTNFQGVDNCNNYVTGELRGADPKIDPLVCASDVITGRPVPNTRGQLMVELQAFNVHDAPPVPDLHDPRVMWATVIRTDGGLNNFPQLGGLRVPYPLVSMAQYFYPVSECKEIA